ncbi:ABC transporter ATP-binding protein [Deinococcus xianganensis]|uniref:ATP-binding cassette domain-containing protein n=1 Tax=Deinococcus xianganensis TaxID=1507289 RepID=A0A6I4YE82_9DEIO|nr:ABC transporter ATP-binding protein [Deinococcus xianganensis]MXV19852.1 ATP-binding cassette domain-containing protein [Deinococcus xianganensis]
MPRVTRVPAPVPTVPPALEGCALAQAFGAQTVLRGVSVAVQPGEVVAVTGPSGSGKSTLLHLLGGLDTPQAGEVHWAGDRVDSLGTQLRAQRRAAQLGLVFQHHYLLEDLTVLDNVLIPTRLSGRGDGVRARELLARVGLSGREDAYPAVLSGGERQRVAVARALAARPAAVLADEPTGSLDRANAQAVAQLLVNLAREEGAGVLLVTHDDRLTRYADRTLHLLDGQFTDEAPDFD